MKGNNELRKYAGMAFQIIATLGVAFFIGYKLDDCFDLSYPIFLLLLPLIALGSFLYQVIRDTNKKNE